MPRLRGREVILALGRATVVAVHRGETNGVGLMGKILRDVEMTSDQFIELL